VKNIVTVVMATKHSEISGQRDVSKNVGGRRISPLIRRQDNVMVFRLALLISLMACATAEVSYQKLTTNIEKHIKNRI
jgi:hypothetical protein